MGYLERLNPKSEYNKKRKRLQKEIKSLKRKKAFCDFVIKKGSALTAVTMFGVGIGGATVIGGAQIQYQNELKNQKNAILETLEASPEYKTFFCESVDGLVNDLYKEKINQTEFADNVANLISEEVVTDTTKNIYKEENKTISNINDKLANDELDAIKALGVSVGGASAVLVGGVAAIVCAKKKEEELRNVLSKKEAELDM